MRVNYQKLNELLFRLMDNGINDAEFSLLSEWLNSSEEAQRYYCRFMSDFSALSLKKITTIEELPENGTDNSGVLMDSDVSLRGMDTQDLLENSDDRAADRIVSEDERILMKALLELVEHEKTAAAVCPPSKKPDRQLIEKVVYPQVEKRGITRFQIGTLIATAAAVLFIVLFVQFVPPKVNTVEIATVVDQMNTVWGDSGSIPQIGSSLRSNEGSLELKKGIVKVQYDDGVEVLVEGPAVFEIERTGLFLEYGRMYSRVSEQGLGFTVRTPTSQFVDMGTEFGIQADVNGSSEVHVIKGKVQLFTGQKETARTGQVVTENKAVRFDANQNTVQPIAVQKTVFARQIKSETGIAWRGQETINLADILGGGDGFGTGRLQHGVSLSNSMIEKVDGSLGIQKSSDSVQIASPFVDRYFIPHGNKPILISSDGGSFSGFPLNTGVCIRPAYYTMACQAEGLYTLRCANTPADEQVPVIWMHSNAGLTFSLENIQKSLTADAIVNRFTTQCSMLSEALKTYESSKNREDVDVKRTYPRVDLTILIDGQVRLQRRELIPDDGIIPIDIEITPEDRYLTLALTDSGYTNHDWTVFAMPTLHITTR